MGPTKQMSKFQAPRHPIFSNFVGADKCIFLFSGKCTDGLPRKVSAYSLFRANALTACLAKAVQIPVFREKHRRFASQSQCKFLFSGKCTEDFPRCVSADSHSETNALTACITNSVRIPKMQLLHCRRRSRCPRSRSFSIRGAV